MLSLVSVATGTFSPSVPVVVPVFGFSVNSYDEVASLLSSFPAAAGLTGFAVDVVFVAVPARLLLLPVAVVLPAPPTGVFLEPCRGRTGREGPLVGCPVGETWVMTDAKA